MQAYTSPFNYFFISPCTIFTFLYCWFFFIPNVYVNSESLNTASKIDYGFLQSGNEYWYGSWIILYQNPSKITKRYFLIYLLNLPRRISTTLYKIFYWEFCIAYFRIKSYTKLHYQLLTAFHSETKWAKTCHSQNFELRRFFYLPKIFPFTRIIHISILVLFEDVTYRTALSSYYLQKYASLNQ